MTRRWGRVRLRVAFWIDDRALSINRLAHRVHSEVPEVGHGPIYVSQLDWLAARLRMTVPDLAVALMLDDETAGAR